MTRIPITRIRDVLVHSYQLPVAGFCRSCHTTREQFASFAMIKKWSWEWFLIWNLAYACVAIMPSLGAHYTFESGGIIGYVFAVMIFWFIGVFAYQFPGRKRIAFNAGMWFLAFSQFLPILQFIAAITAILSLEWLTGQKFVTPTLFTKAKCNSALAGFAVTIVAGQILALETLIAGQVIAKLFCLYDPDEQVGSETSPAKQADLTDANDTFSG